MEFRLGHSYLGLGIMDAFGPEAVPSVPLLQNPNPGSVRLRQPDLFNGLDAGVVAVLSECPQDRTAQDAVEDMLQRALNRHLFYG